MGLQELANAIPHWHIRHASSAPAPAQNRSAHHRRSLRRQTARWRRLAELPPAPGWASDCMGMDPPESLRLPWAGSGALGVVVPSARGAPGAAGLALDQMHRFRFRAAVAGRAGAGAAPAAPPLPASSNRRSVSLRNFCRSSSSRRFWNCNCSICPDICRICCSTRCRRTNKSAASCATAGALSGSASAVAAIKERTGNCGSESSVVWPVQARLALPWRTAMPKLWKSCDQFRSCTSPVGRCGEIAGQTRRESRMAQRRAGNPVKLWRVKRKPFMARPQWAITAR